MIGEATRTVSEAKDRAKTVLAEADAAAEQAVTSARQAVQKAEAEAAEAEGRRKSAEDGLAEIEKEADKVRAYLAKVKGV
jgi:chromosome segregation ATPase